MNRLNFDSRISDCYVNRVFTKRSRSLTTTQNSQRNIIEFPDTEPTGFSDEPSRAADGKDDVRHFAIQVVVVIPECVSNRRQHDTSEQCLALLKNVRTF